MDSHCLAMLWNGTSVLCPSPGFRVHIAVWYIFVTSWQYCSFSKLAIILKSWKWNFRFWRDQNLRILGAFVGWFWINFLRYLLQLLVLITLAFAYIIFYYNYKYKNTINITINYCYVDVDHVDSIIRITLLLSFRIFFRFSGIRSFWREGYRWVRRKQGLVSNPAWICVLREEHWAQMAQGQKWHIFLYTGWLPLQRKLLQ